jgi:hypothetical protein
MDLSCVGTDFLVETPDEGKAPPTPYCLKLIIPGRNFQMAFNTESEKSIWRSWFQGVEDILFGTAVGGLLSLVV